MGQEASTSFAASKRSSECQEMKVVLVPTCFIVLIITISTSLLLVLNLITQDILLIPSPSQEEQVKKYYLQENWLHEDLTKAVANRENVPWIILFGHCPIYAPNEAGADGVPSGTAKHVQGFFEPFLKEYEVDVFLTGHVYAYARTYPTYNNVVTGTSFNNPSSTVHVCAGGAGNREGVSSFPTVKPPWYAGGN